MAQTAAAVQAALDAASVGTLPSDVRIIQSAFDPGGTKQEWYCLGGITLAGRARWVETTASDSAATQAAAIITALQA